MAAKILIPTPLRKLTKNEAEVEVEGSTVTEVLKALEEKFPGFKDRMFDEGGNIRRFINIFVNEQDIRFGDGVNTPVKDGDEVSIVPAVAGG
ncbi:MAG: ubiquitin-like small modifier protein 1 [bacterium]